MMSRQNSFHINSYEDLKEAKKLLKLDIHTQEEAFRNSPIFRISSSLFKGSPFKPSFNTTMESISLDNYKKIEASGVFQLSSLLFFYNYYKKIEKRNNK